MKRIHLIIVLLFGGITVIRAKIRGVPSLVIGGVRYEGQKNIVRAEDAQANKKLWETLIPMDKYREPYKPNLEEDVQWNVITSIDLLGQALIVKNSKGETFELNTKTGHIIKKPQKKRLGGK